MNVKKLSNNCLEITIQDNRYLISYETIVLKQDKAGKLTKCTSEYFLLSNTIMKHINMFLGYKITKKDFEQLETSND